MSEKPEALAVAESLELHAGIPVGFPKGVIIQCVVSRADLSQAAAELRRQHEEIERLRGLLTEARGAKWLVVQNNLLDRIEAALRREEA